MAGFFFGETPPRAMTPGEVDQKRRVAAVMLARVAGPTPQNLGEGIGLFGPVLAARGLQKRADEGEALGRDAARAELAAILGGEVPRGPEAVQPPAAGGASGAPGFTPQDLATIETVESGGNPNAVSPAGARGPMQIMPATAADPGFGVPRMKPEDIDNPVMNRQFGANYLNAMLEEFGGDKRAALAAYNAGPGRVKAAGGDYSKLPTETQGYLEKLKPVYAPVGQDVSSSRSIELAQSGGGGGLQGVDPRIVQALDNPFMSEGQKLVLRAILEQQMQGNAPITPYQRSQLEIDRAQLDRDIFEGDRDFGLDERRFGLEEKGVELDERKLERSSDPITQYEYYRSQVPEGQEPMGFVEFQQAIKGGGTSLSWNPETGQFEFSQGGGGVTDKSSGTPGRTASDKDYAVRYNDWSTSGRADASKNLQQLDAAATVLEGDEDVSGWKVGLARSILPEWAVAGLNPESINVEEMISEVVQRNLRAILGPQFTAKEGEALIKRAYNPNLEEEVNRDRLGRLMVQMREAYEANESAAQYFQKNGTLNGWGGKLYKSADDFLPEERTGRGRRPAPKDLEPGEETTIGGAKIKRIE